ncbi:LysR family transcriptional regulator [Dyella soli]|uniref:LysR family transcriptional regulator n=1 Tax=Dyella soli TaxID=522319 RepID=A0A4V2NLQ9_9GAMM|nr:LysR family transcriptional regulator [Dyella soli]TCI10091.1 LysR family transcriptional regulator [Dyella soli]
MLDAVTLDQLRTFIAAAEEGSFSAAGRKLRRAQSVVSQTLLNLEAQLGVTLFDRSERYPRLTEAGVALLTEARGVADQMDGFKARARSMKEGLEPELSVAVDVMYPMDGLTRAAGYCREFFPNTPLRVYVEALGGVIRPVMDGLCRVGIVGSLPVIPDELASEPLLDLPFVTVVAPSHPLARHKGAVSRKLVEKQVQLVLTDRTPLSEGRTFGVISPLTWRLADLGAKHAFLNAGLGWGHMPLHMVKKDLDAGTLVRIRVEGVSPDATLPMHVVYRKDSLPGPTGRAFISQLRY